MFKIRIVINMLIYILYDKDFLFYVFRKWYMVVIFEKIIIKKKGEIVIFKIRKCYIRGIIMNMFEYLGL